MNFLTKDIDVISFITTAGITGGTEFSAINYLVLALKNNNLWNNIKALYPFVGGTANTHKFNLKNPLDTDGAFRLTFNGTITHDSNGVSFSAVDGWANTHFIPNTHFTINQETLALYSRSSFSAATGGIDMGAATTLTQRSELIIRSNLNGFVSNINSTTDGAGSASISTNTDGTGFYMASRQTSTDLRIYKNGVQQDIASSSNNGTRDAKKIYLGCRNVLNAPNGLTGRNFGLALIASPYTPDEAAIWYNIVQQYNTFLNRQV